MINLINLSKFITGNHFFKVKEGKIQGFASSRFEHWRIYSPFLFYLQYISNSVSILYLLNLKDKQKYTIPFYKRSSEYYVDCEQHKEFIYSCGGYFNEYLNTSMRYNLRTLPNTKTEAQCMNEKRNYTSLVSTPSYLFLIAGCNSTGLLKSCEYFDNQSNSWKLSSNLNNADNSINVIYINSSQLFAFGGSNYAFIEKLYLEKNGLPNSGCVNLNTQNATQSYYGVAFQRN